jgi:hypothetical protein
MKKLQNAYAGASAQEQNQVTAIFPRALDFS